MIGLMAERAAALRDETVVTTVAKGSLEAIPVSDLILLIVSLTATVDGTVARR